MVTPRMGQTMLMAKPQRSREELEAALALCVEAIEAIKWEAKNDNYDGCRWCGAEWQSHAEDGHYTSCLRQRALAAAKG